MKNLNKNVISVKKLKWVNGNPIPYDSKVITQDNAIEMGRAIASEKYTGDEPQYQGLSTLEVIWRKYIDNAVKGNMGVTESLFDRLMGKPTQSNVNHNINENIDNYAYLLKEAKETLKEKNIIDIEKE